MRILPVILLAGGLLPGTALADTYTYTYTGYDFASASGVYTTAEDVTGSLTLSAPLIFNGLSSLEFVTPLSFSFSDGVQTFTNTTANLSEAQFALSPQGTGVPGLWSINLSQPAAGSPGSYNQISAQQHTGASGDQATDDNSPGGQAFSGRSGTWTVTDNVVGVTPEPGSLLLMATGVLVMSAGGFRAKGGGVAA